MTTPAQLSPVVTTVESSSSVGAFFKLVAAFAAGIGIALTIHTTLVLPSIMRPVAIEVSKQVKAALEVHERRPHIGVPTKDELTEIEVRRRADLFAMEGRIMHRLDRIETHVFK